jgi:hypothetical protein
MVIALSGMQFWSEMKLVITKLHGHEWSGIPRLPEVLLLPSCYYCRSQILNFDQNYNILFCDFIILLYEILKFFVQRKRFCLQKTHLQTLLKTIDSILYSVACIAKWTLSSYFFSYFVQITINRKYIYIKLQNSKFFSTSVKLFKFVREIKFYRLVWDIYIYIDHRCSGWRCNIFTKRSHKKLSVSNTQWKFLFIQGNGNWMRKMNSYYLQHHLPKLVIHMIQNICLIWSVCAKSKKSFFNKPRKPLFMSHVCSYWHHDWWLENF